MTTDGDRCRCNAVQMVVLYKEPQCRGTTFFVILNKGFGTIMT